MQAEKHAGAAPKRRARRLSLKRREALTGWVFVSPALIGFAIFTFGAIIRSFYYSLTDYSLLSQPNFVGLANYIRAFTKDQYFYQYFGNTFYFVITLVPIVLVCSLLLAILINKKARALDQGLPGGAVFAQHHLHCGGEYGLAVDLQPGHGHPEQHSHCHRPE